MKSRFRSILVIGSVIFWTATAFAQQEQTTLGIVYRPIIPAGIFGNRVLNFQRNNVDFKIAPKESYSIGATMRNGLRKQFSLETGIHYIRRTYETTVHDSGYTVNSRLRFTDYEIPVTGLIYIRLGGNMFMNANFGLSVDFFPNDVESFNDRLLQRGGRKYWILPGLVAGTGFEYRTPKSGYFYLGGTYHRMLLRMADIYLRYSKNPPVPAAEVFTTMPGHYFGFELKYFFPTQRTEDAEYDYPR